MPKADRLSTLRALLSGVRTASLSTLDRGAPFGSMVPFAWDPAGRALIHVSALARHTRHLEADPRVALLVTETDGPGKNPLALQRACLTGTMRKVARGTPAYEAAKALYVARFPGSAMVFQLPDFTFYTLAPEAIHLVAGFGQAFAIDPAELAGA
ncbi:MAG: pyridoxamine 5'-phosphate oxidase family protein [Nitrospirae bacterium]|nr:pyridoxamine 5'-phosphate oxidase family protein [Nitrospirota bacterium]